MTIEKERIEDEIIDNLLKDYKEPEDLIGENGLLKDLTKQTVVGAGDGGGTPRAVFRSRRRARIKPEKGVIRADYMKWNEPVGRYSAKLSRDAFIRCTNQDLL